MNAETFAEWLRRQGYQVYQTESSYWYTANPRVLQAFPYHWLIQPSDVELRKLILGKGIVACRYSTPIEAPHGKVSYHAIYDQPGYTLEGLDRRARQNVRAGFKNCSVEKISLERLAEEGWGLEMDTASRQGRSAAVDRERWRRKYLAAVDLPGFEGWGALVENRLVASLFSFQMDDCCELISQQCNREFLSARVNNALSFYVTELMINRPGIRSIFYTLQSLDAPASVDEFKFRMGYVPKPLRQRVLFHPWLEPVVRSVGQKILKQLIRWQPENPALGKIQGMVNFYLEGRRPLQAQSWPECLEPYKPGILGIELEG